MNGDRFTDVIWPFIEKHEGGFTKNLGDGAGATAYGITQVTLERLWKHQAAWMAQNLMPKDTAQLSKPQATLLARKFYFETPDLHLLPPPLDLVATDYLFHGGPALKDLNLVVGMKGTQITINTVQAATSSPKDAALKLVEKREAYLKNLKSWNRFHLHWSKRLEALRRLLA